MGGVGRIVAMCSRWVCVSVQCGLVCGSYARVWWVCECCVCVGGGGLSTLYLKLRLSFKQ